MATDLDAAIWEAYLRQLLVDYGDLKDHYELDAQTLQTLNTLGRLLARDPYVAFLEY